MGLENSLKDPDVGPAQNMLQGLEARIHESTMNNIARSDLFSSLMSWLDDQIKQDIITQNGHLLEGFVKLLRMHGNAEIEPFDLTQVDEVFTEWLEKDAVQNSAYRRRYLITQQDMHRLFALEEGRPWAPEASSPFSPRCKPGNNFSPALLCEPEENGVRAEPENAVHNSPPLERGDVAGIDRFYQLNISTDTDAVLSLESNNIPSQVANVDDVTTTQEIAVAGFSPSTEISRQSSKVSCRSRKRKVRNDSLEFSTVPKDYICKRCHEPGHWIQHCPTNLDPRYDQPPPYDYRCNFCGQEGEHFATLCSKNPHRGSLMKQRKHATVKLQEPQNPTDRNGDHYQEKEYLGTNSRDRCRSRSPEYRRSSQDRTETCDYQTQNGGDKRRVRLRDEPDLYPYAKRARSTQDPYTRSGTANGRVFWNRLWDDPFQLKGELNGRPLVSCQEKKPQRRHRDLDKVTASTEEGRLAYDDETDALIGATLSPFSPMSDRSRPISTRSIDIDEVAEPALPCATAALEELEEAKNKADGFLRALAAEITLEGDDIHPLMTANPYGAETGTNTCRMEIHVNDNDQSNHTNIDREPIDAQTIPSPKYQQVLCPPFSHEIVSLFNTRANPIINITTNRQTASQMMHQSEKI